MDGKNYLVKECVDISEDYNLDVKVARNHNIYGPNGTTMVEEKKRQRHYAEKLLMRL